MTLQGENILLRIFVETTRRWHQEPVYEALVEEARRRGLAGATVLEGIEGFGQNGRMHQERLLGLAAGHEVVIEIVDAEDKINQFLESVRPLLAGAVVTLERAWVALRKTGAGR